MTAARDPAPGTGQGAPGTGQGAAGRERRAPGREHRASSAGQGAPAGSGGLSIFVQVGSAGAGGGHKKGPGRSPGQSREDLPISRC